MGQEYVTEKIAEIEELAKQEGLDFFPTIFEFVDKNIMLEGCSYGLPVRARHWSYGRSYQHQKLYGEMGFSKVYEIVFNNDPSYAFLLNTNPDIINIMVGAHVYGHVHFFKHNVMFQDSDRGMIYRAAERATRIDEYIEEYGLNKVEHLMDIAFALDNHIDFHKGIFRKKYPVKRTVTAVRKKDEFEDLLNFGNNSSKRSVSKKVIGSKLPPHPEKDLLWFLANYAPLDDWERDILTIIREESFYFYPIVMTKVMNEGFACVLPDTLVYTNNGIMTMDNLVDGDASVIYDGEKYQEVLHSGIFNNRDVISIKTKSGFSISGANNHRVFDINRDWKQLDELSIGDKVKLSGGNNMWPKDKQVINYKPSNKAVSAQELCKSNNISYSTYYRNINNICYTTNENINKIKNIQREIKRYSDENRTSSMGNRNIISFPSVLDEDMASMLGYLIGDGHVSDIGRQVGFTSGDEYSANHACELFKKLFSISANKRWDNASTNGRWRVIAYSKELIDFLTEAFEFTVGRSSRVKKIPSLILKSPKNVMSSFLRAYFDSDGCASEKQGVILSTSSDKLVEQTQIVLMNYGILSSRKKANDGCWQLRITGQSAKVFSEEIGFGLSRKQNKLQNYINNHKWFKEEKWEDEIVSIEYCGKKDVYDISVSQSHRYAAAGFINHNSFWHAELMYKANITEQEYIEFAKTHSGVVNPGNPFNINPYYLGFKVFTDIREKWDKLYEEGKSSINGIQKVIEVAAEEDDASFLRNYLTKELAAKLGLFNYGYKLKRDPDMKKEDLTEEHGIIEIKDRELDKIIDNIIRPTINYGAPFVTVDESDGDTLVLNHRDGVGPLDEKYTEKTMEYIYELWGGPVELKTYDHDGQKIAYVYDESGFDIGEG